MSVECACLVRSHEHDKRRLNLDFSRRILRLDEVLDFLNRLNAVQSRHHEVGEDVSHFLACLDERRNLHHRFLTIVDKLTEVRFAYLCKLLFYHLHVVQLILGNYDFALLSRCTLLIVAWIGLIQKLLRFRFCAHL